MKRHISQPARWGLFSAALLVLVTAAASWGAPAGPLVMLVVIVERLAVSGGAAAGLLAVAVGLGLLVEPVLFPRARDRWTMRVGIGLSLALTLWHGFGAVGMLGPVAAWAVAIAGMAGWIRWARDRVVRRGRPGFAPGAWAWAGLPGMAVLIAAAASVPGGLWASEFGGYDALSYHLPLPQSWLYAGIVWPTETNVYSYLPSYLEVMFAQFGAITLAPRGEGLLAGDGWRLIACQFLHAWLTIAAAWGVTRVVRTLAPMAGIRHGRTRTLASAVAGGVVLLTPWSVVVGSLAYNEMGVVLLGSCALVAAMDRGLSPTRRWMLTAVLVGAACGVKPTALFLVGPAVGIALVGRHTWDRSRKGLLRGAVLGCVVGAMMLAPWMARNAVASGNPVFPFASGVFGTAHWDGAQAEAWRRVHGEVIPLEQRARLAVWRAPGVDAAAPITEAHRGMSSPQWGIVFPLAAMGVCVLCFRRWSHAVGVLLGAGLIVTLGCWLVLTHVQSRFLVPLLVTAAPAIGLGVSVLRGRGVAVGIGVVVLVVQSAFLVRTWVGEGRGQPARYVLRSPDVIRGRIPEAIGEATPVQVVNDWRRTRGGAGPAVMLGEAATVYYDGPVIASTAWDRTRLERAMESSPDDPGAWVRTLRDMGASVLVVNFAELDRMVASGYRPASVGSEAAARLVDRLRVIGAWRDLGVVVCAVTDGGVGDGVGRDR